MANDAWTPVLALADLPAGRLTVVRPGRHQIVLWRAGAVVHAVDNVCPHEGYPLVQGRVNDGVLTCDWHNFKYRLGDGRCLVPGEDVRVFAARVRDGRVELNLAEPDPGPERAARLASLQAALGDGAMDWAARDVVRLLELGLPLPALAEVLLRDACARAPRGFLHGQAVAVDALGLAQAAQTEGRDPGVALLHAAESVAEPLVRRPAVAWPAPRPGGFGDDPGEARAAFRAAIEADHVDALVGGVRGQLAAGLSRPAVGEWLVAAATDHFLSFGHGAIFTQKALEALDTVGWHLADAVVPALARWYCAATRHDTLPYMRGFAERCRALAPELPALSASAFGDPGDRLLDEPRFQALVQDGGPAGAFDAVAGALRDGVHPDRIAGALVRAAAERLWQFDPALPFVEDRDFGWLDVTHVLTHAHATRALLRAAPTAEAVRGLFHSAFFVQQLAREAVPSALRRAPHPAEGEPEGLAAALDQAARRREPDGAAAAALGFLAAGGGVDALGRHLERLALADCSVVRIVVDHDIKTAVAAHREAAGGGHGAAAGRILGGVARYLAADKHERFTARDWRFAADFVRLGRPSIGTFQE